MKRTKLALALVSTFLLCALSVNLGGCSAQIQAKDLMEKITPNEVTPLDDLDVQSADMTDFAVRLFQSSEKEGENTLISPLSVICALAMVLNGAEGETKAQMEAMLGMSAEELNLYLYSYVNSLPHGEKYKLSLANSIWFADGNRIDVNGDFLQTNADYYGADIYEAPFDESTLKDINNWVKKETDGMIPEILDEIPADALMYLINALAFEAQWREAYDESQIKDGIFTKEDGTKQDAEFMYGMESGYFDDGNATGFIKYYDDEKYAFVAMLPNEGVSVSEYVDSLDGEELCAMLSSPQSVDVMTSMPKFEIEYGTELSDALKAMGITDAFSTSECDLSGIGRPAAGDLFIGKVIHKTYISVSEKGTRAGAVTSIEATNGGVSAPISKPKTVYLDRPFVYMLVDCETNVPLFMGTVTDIEN